MTSANSPGRLLVSPGSAVTATAGSVAASTVPLRSVMSPREGSKGSFWVRAAADSAAYFHSRPHASQLGAWASRQSSVLGSRSELDERYAELARRWPEEVPAPEFWGGFVVVPSVVEFWQGRTSRLHDRLRYTAGDGGWDVVRLAP